MSGCCLHVCMGIKYLSDDVLHGQMDFLYKTPKFSSTRVNEREREYEEEGGRV